MKTYLHPRSKLFYNIISFLIITTSFLNGQMIETDSLKDTSRGYLKTDKNLPILNNFRFIPSDVINDPFITSFVKTSVGAGAVFDLYSYVKDLQGNIRDTLSGDLSYISAELQFQFAVNKWLALNGSYVGSGRLGNNPYTILTSGISYATGFTLGGKAKLWENKSMMLSGSVDFRSSEVFLYSVYDFVKEVIENGEIDSSSNESLLEKDNTTLTFFNLNYAYAPADWCGILAVAGWGIGNSFNGKDKGNVRLGTAVSVDFANIKHINFPIGLLASVRYNSYAESGENTENVIIFGFRIGYTGHKDFDIGIENTYQSLNYRLSDESIKTLLTSFKMRYYF